MRRFLLLLLIFTAKITFAQPANDECLDAIVLNNITNYCSAVDEYTNSAATLSAGYALPINCTPPWTGDQRDVWFTFTVPIGGFTDYLIEINGNTMSSPQVAIYRGACSYLAELTCAAAPIGQNSISMEAIGLDPGIQYWIRVNDWDNAGGTNEGDFQLCISEYIPPVNMMNGMSTNCNGTLYDTGGPTGDYLNNEAFTYVVCPSDPHTCLIFDITSYGIEEDFDFLRFYNGPDPTAPLIGELTGNGGNVQIEANSGCMTIVWTSDFTGAGFGWEANWSCVSTPCSPDGSGVTFPDVVDCSGIIMDSGADTTGYLTLENWEYSICPNVPNSCITLTLDEYDIASPDVLTFYDGPSSASPSITEVSGTGQNKTIFASSGCMTVGFNSNFQINGEGWSGTWTCSTDPCPLPEPMVVDPDVTGQELIDQISAPGVVVLNVDTTGCLDEAIGIFTTNGFSEIGITSGIVMSSGLAENAEGPNDDNGGADGFGFGAPGDPTLDSISGGSTNDACALEFDIFAATSNLTFRYVFGSDEYPEFAPPQSNNFNDVFGFFISGPGITGEQNLALLPGGIDEVSIGNINPITNTQYYVDNENGITTEYDGFSTVLTAEATVIPCQTYHLKLVVADFGDDIYDTGVFIEAGSLTSGVASVSPVFDFSPDLDYTIEGCAEASITIVLDEAQMDTTVIYISPSGTATPDVDYTALPDSIVFPPGITEVTVPFNPVFDGVDEGDEFAVFNLIQIAACGTFVYDSAVVEIHDNVLPEFVGYTGGDTLSICKGDSIQLVVSGGVTFEWSPLDIVSDPAAFNPYVFPTEDSWVYITANVASCTGLDSLYIQVRDITVDIPFGDTIGICQDDLVQLESVVNLPGGSYSWEPATDVIGSPPTVPSPAVQPDTTTTYFVTYEVDGCPNTDSVVVSIGNGVPLYVIPDTTICLGNSVVLAGTPNGASYSWTPTTGLNDPNIANPQATPTQTTTYTVTGSGGGGSCTSSASVTVMVVPNIEVTAADDVTICLGDSIEVSASSPDSGDYFWAPSASVLDPYAATTIAFPTETTTYLVSLDNGECIVYDNLTVTVVEELPLELQADTTICMGESVILGEPGFPGATYTWSPDEYLDTPNIPNPLATPDVTTTYTVNASNGTCDSEGDVTVSVLNIPTVDAGPDQNICENGTAQLTSTGTNATNYTWTPAADLSCSDCPDPVATPTETTTYYVEYANDECSNVDSMTVFVDGSFAMTIAPTGGTIYQGDTVSLLATPSMTGSNPLGPLTYDWMPSTGILLTDANAAVVAPLETTVYTVTATSEGGCTNSMNVEIVVLAPAFTVPNAFTPNGDGMNDQFNLGYVGNIKVMTFQIFDRWGEVVFNNEDSNGWDGSYEGEPMPQDVYIYNILVVLPDGTQEVLTGDVTLLR